MISFSVTQVLVNRKTAEITQRFHKARLRINEYTSCINITLKKKKKKWSGSIAYPLLSSLTLHEGQSKFLIYTMA